MMRLAAILAMLGCLGAGSAQAAGFDGGQPAAFMKLGVGARQQGMGRMAVPSQGDPFAYYYNPALLAALERIVVGAQTSLLPGDRSLNFFAAARPVTVSKTHAYYGLSYMSFSLNAPIEIRKSDTPEPDNTVMDSQNAIQLAVAGWPMEGILAAGLNVRLVNENLGEATASGISGDIGALLHATSWLDFGISLHDVFGRMSWSTGSAESFPLLVRANANARLFSDRLTVGGEVEKSATQEMKFRTGLEWRVPAPSPVDVRVGFNNFQWTTGFGLKFNPWGVGTSLDYALATDPLEPGSVEPGSLAHRLSLSLDFAATQRKEAL